MTFPKRPRGENESRAGARPGRPRRADDWIVPVWLAVAFVVTLIHRWVPESTWLMLHLVLLGALTHSAVVWSEHFTQALLKTPPGPDVPVRANRRLLALGALLVFVGVPAEIWWLTLAGALVVSGAVLVHGWRLVRDLRRALPGRFRVTIRYYVAGALCLPVGAGFGATLAFGLTDEWHARFLVAHTMINLLGWVGLTVVGTLVTFWPTVLRTRMDPRADPLARQALPVLIAGLALIEAGALSGLRWLTVGGLVVYATGLVWSGRSLVVAVRGRRPREFASASIGVAVVWFAIAVLATGGVLATAPDARAVTAAYPTLAALWGVGFATQLLLGALSYLLPSVIGGGPSVVRASGAEFDRFATARLAVVNAGLPLWLAPASPSWVKVTVSTLGLVALASFLPLMVRGLRAGARERRHVQAGGVPAPLDPKRTALTASGLLAGLTALATVVALGVAVDPAAAGLPATGAPGVAGASAPAASGVTPTGRTVDVTVTAQDMRFCPNRIEAGAGDRVVIHLVNADPTATHDLAIAGHETARLAPGGTETLDLGPVSASVQGWCTVVGHRQMGMTLDLVVAGAAAAPSASATSGTGHASHTTPASASPLTSTVDPVAPPAATERLHRMTLRVQEVPLEVAPGVWQKRWTYNGAGVGPTLRGRVGDVFEVTLVNEGSIGHSIDFHAGSLAPDEPMRTIAPGTSLVYRFTATRSGIWMYHCSSHPMSMHIAAGMHGAVIIDPEGLPTVDREYVLVQSEVYLASAATSAAAAEEVDGDAVLAEQPTSWSSTASPTSTTRRLSWPRWASGSGSGSWTPDRPARPASTSSELSSTRSTSRAPISCATVGTPSARRRTVRRRSVCSPHRAGSWSLRSPDPATMPWSPTSWWTPSVAPTASCGSSSGSMVSRCTSRAHRWREPRSDPRSTADGVPAGTPGRRALAAIGDDPDAVATVGRLIDSFGLDALEVTPLTEGWRIQRDTPGYGPRLTPDSLREALTQAWRYRDM